MKISGRKVFLAEELARVNNPGFEACLISWSFQDLLEIDRRVCCPLYEYFYVHFMGHLFFLLKISCAFLEVGVGEVERKNYFTISLLKSAQ